MEDNKRVEYPFNNQDCPEFDTCFELKIAMSQKEKDDQKGEITKDVIFQTAGGSPLGVYPTLADIQTAYDTGEIDSTKGVYLSMDDGFWNYYDHKLNKWVKGKLYQGTAVNPEDPTIVKINDAILTVGDNLNEHIGNATIKFGEINTHQDLQDKRLDNHNDRLNQIENELHETEVVEVKESYTGNRINVPTSAEVEGRNFGVIDNQYFKVSAIKGQTRKSKNRAIWETAFPPISDLTNVQIGNVKITKNIVDGFNSNNQYTITSKGAIKKSGGFLFVYVEYTDGDSISFRPSEELITLITKPKQLKIIRFSYSADGIYDLSNWKFQIEKGTQATPFEKHFSGIQDTTIKNITSVGTNRANWKPSFPLSTDFSNANIGTLNFKRNIVEGLKTNSQYAIKAEGAIKKSGAGTLVIVVDYADGNTDSLSIKDANAVQLITQLKEVKDIRFTYNTDAFYDFSNFKLQIEEGAMTTTYRPYMVDKTIELKPNQLTLKGTKTTSDEAILTKTNGTELFEVDVITITKEIDLGDLNWIYSGGKYIGSGSQLNDSLEPITIGVEFECSKYDKVDTPAALLNNDLGAVLNSRYFSLTKEIHIRDINAKIGDVVMTAPQYKEYIKGTKLLFDIATPTRAEVVKNLPLGDVSVLGQKGGEFQINPIEPNIVEPKETSFNFDIRYWEQPTKGGNL